MCALEQFYLMQLASYLSGTKYSTKRNILCHHETNILRVVGITRKVFKTDTDGRFVQITDATESSYIASYNTQAQSEVNNLQLLCN